MARTIVQQVTTTRALAVGSLPLPRPPMEARVRGGTEDRTRPSMLRAMTATRFRRVVLVVLSVAALVAAAVVLWPRPGVPVRGTPTSLAVTPDGSRAYVGLVDDSVSVVDLGSGAISKVPGLSGDLYRVVIAPDSRRAYVLKFNSAEVTVVDTATNARVGEIPIPRAVSLAGTPKPCAPRIPPLCGRRDRRAVSAHTAVRRSPAHRDTGVPDTPLADGTALPTTLGTVGCRVAAAQTEVSPRSFTD